MFLVQQGSHSTSCYYRDKECFKCHNKGQAKHACRTQVKGKETKSVHMMDGDSDVNQTYIKTLDWILSFGGSGVCNSRENFQHENPKT